MSSVVETILSFARHSRVGLEHPKVITDTLKALFMFHYVIALGSNRCHGRYGSPARIIDAAADVLPIVLKSRTIRSRSIGPSQRRYANAVAIIETRLLPPDLLDSLKAIERQFGRRGGQRWGARVLDLDIILWSDGMWSDSKLAIPHRAFRDRGFVLGPLTEIAPQWRDALTAATLAPRDACLVRALSSVGRATDF
jgi:2-amino-4-hydroxy-6-hydroxymethyldihydropteridine diphosphokinase